MGGLNEKTPIMGGRRKYGVGMLIGACIGSLILGMLLTAAFAFMNPFGLGSGSACTEKHTYAAKVWKEGNISFYGLSYNPDDDFTYADSHWANPTCKDSGMQSPIDLEDQTSWGVAANLVPLKAGYSPSPLQVLNNGKAILFDFAKSDNWMLTPGGNYSLLNVRFHYPSEHTFNGAKYEMEIQFFHKNQKRHPPADNKFGIISVFVKEGQANPAFPKDEYKFSQFLPTVTGVQHNIQGKFNLLNLLPQNHASPSGQYLFYTGSLSRPPCSENVKYYVYTQPIEMSREQINVFSSVTKLLPAADKNGYNARPIQSRGPRAVLVSNPAGSSPP